MDYLLRGEAEYTFSKLLNCLETEAALDVIEAIPGIGMRRNGIPFISPDVPHIEHLDALPLPAYDLLPLSCYYGGSPDVEAENPERSFTMISSRGCPGSCTFCCEPVVFGHKFRARSAKNIVDEIQYLLEHNDISHINFYDASFMVDRSRVQRICEEIVRRRLPITWRARARADQIDGSLARTMSQAGCTELAVGVESGSQRVLDLLNKRTSLRAIEAGFAAIRDAGMWISAFFIFGAPGETLEESLETIRFAIRLDPDWALFSHGTPLPGTKMYQMVQEHLLTRDWSQFRFSSNSPVFTYGGMTKEQIQCLMDYAYRAFYIRKEWLVNRLTKARRAHESLQIVESFFDYLRKAGVPSECENLNHIPVSLQRRYTNANTHSAPANATD